MKPSPFAAPAEEDGILATINTTPLVDVMLVLLIIFLITIPVVNTSVAVELPKQRHEPRESRPENILISVDPNGRIFWFDTPVESRGRLSELLAEVAKRKPQPEVQIRGDRSARYSGIGTVVATCQQAGIRHVAFVTEPPARD